MRVRRDSTSCDTSLMIFAFSFGDRVVNHFASLYAEVGRISTQTCSRTVVGHDTAKTYDFALPREQDQVATGIVSH
jgi:hypothetical protein